MERYNSARDMFEAARTAAQERDSALRQMDAMRSARGLKAAAVAPSRGGGRDINGTLMTVELLDFEGRMKERIKDDEALLEACAGVLYGEGGRGGVSRLLSARHADAAFWRYLAAESWRTCSLRMGESERTIKRLCEEAFDMVDAVGHERALRGEGIATA